MRIPVPMLVTVLLLGACTGSSEGDRLTPAKAPVNSRQEACPPAAAPVQNRQVDAVLAGLRLGAPLTRGNLTIIPLRGADSGAGPGGEYLTLTEAMAAKQVLLEEVEGGGSVPTLEITSQAEKKIFMPYGAIVTGGKQDRMIMRDLVLLPGEKRQVKVCCIEQGRWRPGASGSRFTSCLNIPTNCLRTVANNPSTGSQAAIWQLVARTNSWTGNSSSSSNFQTNYETPKFAKARQEYAPILTATEKMQDVKGVVLLIRGRPVGIEVFASPQYFKKVWPAIFKGYVVDAITALDKPQGEAAQQPAPLAAARDYLARARSMTGTTRELPGAVEFTLKNAGQHGIMSLEREGNRLIHLHIVDLVAASLDWVGDPLSPSNDPLSPNNDRPFRNTQPPPARSNNPGAGERENQR